MLPDQSFLNQLMRYFFRGLLLIIPLAVTFYVISFVWRKVDNLVGYDHFPGLGMFIAFASITLLGYVGTTLAVKSTIGFAEDLIQKVPFIRELYSSLKDFTSAFVNSKGKFDQPVMVLMDQATPIYRIGFITRQSLEIISMPNHVAVYLPNSYDFSGLLLIVPAAWVIPLDLPNAEVMKFILSGGVTLFKNVSTTDNKAEDPKE